MKSIKIKYKTGKYYNGVIYDENDYVLMKSILKSIKENNNKLNNLGGRKINIPDVISEGIYCYHFNATRTNGSAKSYDAINLESKKGIQIKSSSIKNDLTSFGPKSTWDELIYMDFSDYLNTSSREIHIYKIEEKIEDYIMNKSKNETFKDQQKQNRRPRLSIKKIINDKKIQPMKIINLD